jgi:hypothetical protein
MQLGSGFTCASLSDALQPYGSFIGSGGCGKNTTGGGSTGYDFGQQEGPPISPADKLAKTSKGDITVTEEEPEVVTAEGPGRACSHAALVQKTTIRGTH